MTLRACLVLALASRVALARVALADVAPPTPPRALPVHALRGPFASLEAYCAARRRRDPWVRDCSVARHTAHAAALVIRAGGDQRTAVLAIARGGWWIDEGADGHDLLYDGNRSRGGFALLALGDGNGDGDARLRAVQAHWHKGGTADEPAFDDHDVYYCFALEVHCRLPGAGAPVCTDLLPVAGQRDCGLASVDDAASFDARRWDWQQTVRARSNGGIEVRRLRWRRFPTRLDGYNDWMRDTVARARALAGTWTRGGR